MKFPYVIHKLKQILGNQQTLVATGRDNLAPGRVKELKEAIDLLKQKTL